MNHQRRRTDRLPVHVCRDSRIHVPSATKTDAQRGWIAYGMSQQLPADASAEMRAGYAEHRNDIISRLGASQ